MLFIYLFIYLFIFSLFTVDIKNANLKNKVKNATTMQ